jgi:hypothetical protein
MLALLPGLKASGVYSPASLSGGYEWWVNFNTHQELPYNAIVASGGNVYFLNIVFLPIDDPSVQGQSHQLINGGISNQYYRTIDLFYSENIPMSPKKPRKKPKKNNDYATTDFDIGYKPGINGFDTSTLV